jgi:hypothetical protein
MRIAFLNPTLPPAFCSMGEHTQFLAQTMLDEGIEVGFIHEKPLPPGSTLCGLAVHQWNGRPGALPSCVGKLEPDWLWVQLSSYGYSRWGAPFVLGRALAALRRSMPGLGIVVYAHETHCQPRQLGRKGFLLSPWQRHTVGRIVRLADLVFTSNLRYERQIARDYGVPSSKISRLPLPAQVPVPHFSAGQREQYRKSLGWNSEEVVAVTFGTFASQLRALGQCGPHLARGLASRQLHRVVCIGGIGTGAVPRGFERWAKSFAPLGAFEVLGYQPAATVGEILEASDFAFSPYPRRLLGKSGVFTAFALAGLAVLVTDGDAVDELDGDDLPVLSAATWDWSQARSERVLAMRRALQEHVAVDYTWPAITRRALAAMRTMPRGPLLPSGGR